MAEIGGDKGKKKKKRRTLKKLEEDDYELINENTGVNMKRKRLKKHSEILKPEPGHAD